MDREKNGNWKVDREQLSILGDDEKGEVSFTKAFENGLEVKKTFSLVRTKMLSSWRWTFEMDPQRRCHWNLDWSGSVRSS